MLWNTCLLFLHFLWIVFLTIIGSLLEIVKWIYCKLIDALNRIGFRDLINRAGC